MKKKQKAPAYMWYPRDFASDEKVMLMSLEEEGAYRRMLDHQWLHGSVPLDLGALAIICKGLSKQKMRRIWACLSDRFPPLEGDQARGANPRLERSRAVKEDYEKAMHEAGKKGAEKRWGGDSQPNSHPTEKPLTKNAFAFASSSSFAGTTTTPNGVAVDGSDNGGDDKFTAWRDRVPATYRDAVHGALRAAQNPDALRREFVGLEHPITGGPAYGPEVVGQAVHEMAVAGSRMSSKALKAFCRRVAEPEKADARAELDQWSPENIAKIGEAA